MTFALVSTANARPQEYEDYDQPSPRAALQQKQQQQQHNHHQQHIKRQQDEDRETSTVIPIIHYDKEQDLSGAYKTRYVCNLMINRFFVVANLQFYIFISYETGNHIISEESGYLKDVNEEGYGTLVQKGSYSYEAPDGQVERNNDCIMMID